jgi:rare lipoprotein A
MKFNWMNLIGFVCFFPPVFALENKIVSGKASYYTTASCQKEGTSGINTANGENFNEQALTCALRSREFGSLWKVTNKDNGKSIIVRQNDFGPNLKCEKRGVIIDLTPMGFKMLGAGKKGMLNVSIERVKKGEKK